MISGTLSNQSTDNFNKIINIKLLINNIKQHKVLIIIAGIILFFARPLIQIIALMGYYNNSYVGDTIESFTRDFSQGSGPIVTAAAFVLALAIGLNVSSYMHNRKAAIFYGSIPIKRINLFATQYLSGLTYFLPAFLVSFILSTLIMPFKDAMLINAEYYLGALFFFLLIYSFVILCANIAGTFLNSLLAAAYFCAIIPAAVYTVLGFADTFYRFTSFSGIMANPVTELIFYPVVIFIPKVFLAYEYLTVLDCALMLVFAAGLTCLAYLFNRLTKTENAEKPFYFTKFLAALKYSALAVLFILAGIIFFTASGYNFIFFIVGIIVGGFFAFILVNLVIYKNLREVFKGVKQYLLLAVLACIFSGLVYADIFGIDSYIPAASGVKSVSFNQWDTVMHNFSYEHQNYSSRHGINIITINDTETVQLVNDVFTAALKSATRRTRFYTEYGLNFSDYAYNSHPLRIDGGAINYNLKNGITWAKKLNIHELFFYNQDDLREFDDAVDKLYESPGYKKAYYYPLTDGDIIRENLDLCMSFEISLTREDSYLTVFHKSITREQMQALINVINQDISKLTMRNNRIWSYNAAFTFRTSDNRTGHINVKMNEYEFADTIRFILHNLD